MFPVLLVSYTKWSLSVFEFVQDPAIKVLHIKYIAGKHIHVINVTIYF